VQSLPKHVILVASGLLLLDCLIELEESGEAFWSSQLMQNRQYMIRACSELETCIGHLSRTGDYFRLSGSGTTITTRSKGMGAATMIAEGRRAQLGPQDARTIGDIVSAESRFFLKSEWGPVSPYWPALSFKKPQVGDFLRDNYDPSCDFILYAGTSDPKKTKDKDWRKRLLSILVIEPGERIRTEELVPPDSWKAVKKEHGQEWPWSFAVRQGWDCIEHPWAHNVTPVAYRSLGFRNNMGGVVEVPELERQALLSVAIRWIELPNRKVVETTSAHHDALRKKNREERVLSDALKRMAGLITGRLGPGSITTRITPPRTLPDGTDLGALLAAKLLIQKNLCALCGRSMRLDTSKKLLQCSPDRIDSVNPSYGAENLQITHLACNLAKNDGTAEEFNEWLSLASDTQRCIEF